MYIWKDLVINSKDNEMRCYDGSGSKKSGRCSLLLPRVGVRKIEALIAAAEMLKQFDLSEAVYT